MAEGGAVTHVEAGGSAAYWNPGSQILWRYRENAGERLHIVRPVTVVRDDEELLAVWLAPGTECVKPVLADGTPVHAEPLETRYTKPRTVQRDRWFGTGVLKLARPGEPWSVWLFWEPGWQFKNWYVNLEEPLARWSGGVDSEDHFPQAQRDGLMNDRLAARVTEAGRAAVEVIRRWGPPYSAGWEHWRPDPAWSVPSLPDDWDRTPAHVST
jgi:hypothetical protein